MRILQLINSLDVGGAERVVTNLSLELQARGHLVHIICLRDLGMTPTPESEIRARGVRLTALEKEDGFSRTALAQLVAYARRERIDVIHTHNPQVNHYGVLTARRAGVRALVNTVHGVATLEMAALADALFRVSCLFTSRVVSVCEPVAEACRRALPLWPGRGRVIHNGIELEPFTAVRRTPRNGSFRFAAMGRLTPVKDYATMFAAFARFGQAATLDILGVGEQEEELRQLARNLGISTRVRFCGFSRDVAGFMSGADCFLMSSASEGLPMAVLEAMASGLPIVSTAVGGVPALVRGADCGWLSPPGDVEALAAAMRQAISAADLETRGQRARASVAAQYSVAAMTGNYERLFEELLSPN